MERLLLVRCPALLLEDEGGGVLRTFARVAAAASRYCPWVTAVRPGVCVLPARGPARLFGGEAEVVHLVAEAVGGVDGAGDVEVGVADGLFAAHLAARTGVLVPPGESAAFLAPWPVLALERPELAELLPRLGIHTLGAFAELPALHVLARFGRDGAACHRVAAAFDGELPGFRQPAMQRRLEAAGGGRPAPPLQAGFWGGHRDADARAARALADVQRLLGPGAVQVARRQGGRNPAEQVRFVTWSGLEMPVAAPGGEPWPGQIPPPAPATVHSEPPRAELLGTDGQPVTVTGHCELSAPPCRLSVAGDRWTDVVAWAGPWPMWERWWRPGRRRAARLQVVGRERPAQLLIAQRGTWWLSATYD